MKIEEGKPQDVQVRAMGIWNLRNLLKACVFPLYKNTRAKKCLTKYKFPQRILFEI